MHKKNPETDIDHGYLPMDESGLWLARGTDRRSKPEIDAREITEFNLATEGVWDTLKTEITARVTDDIVTAFDYGLIKDRKGYLAKRAELKRTYGPDEDYDPSIKYGAYYTPKENYAAVSRGFNLAEEMRDLSKFQSAPPKRDNETEPEWVRKRRLNDY